MLYRQIFDENFDKQSIALVSYQSNLKHNMRICLPFSNFITIYTFEDTILNYEIVFELFYYFLTFCSTYN